MRNHFILFLLLVSVLSAAIYLLAGNQRTETIQQNIQERFENYLEDQSADLDAFESDFSVYTNPFAIGQDKRFSKRVFVNGSLVYWNDNKFLPSYNEFRKPKELYTVETENGIWLINRRHVLTDHDLIEIYSIFSLYENPLVANQYLSERLNTDVFEQYDVDLDQKGEYGIVYEDLEVFRLNIYPQSTSGREVLSVILLFVFSVYLIFVVFVFLRNIKSHAILNVGFILSLVAGRTILFLYTSNQVVNWDLFDPIYFTLGTLCPSLGDAILHAFFLLVGVIYILRQPWIKTYGNLTSNQKFSLVAGLAVFNFIAIYLLQFAVWQLLEHSQIELDISESIQFDGLRIAAFSGILFLCGLVILLFGYTQYILKQLTFRKTHLYVIVILVSAGFSLLGEKDEWLYYGVFGMIWLLLDFFKFNHAVDRIKYQTFVFLVLVFLCLSVVFALSVYKHHEKDDLVAKEKFANHLLIRNDIMGEYYLSQIMDEIADDRYIRTRLMTKVLARNNIREKIKRQFLSNYFKKYDIEVLLFSEDGESLQSEYSPSSYYDWLKKYRVSPYLTDYDGIYFVEDKEENVRNRYVCFIEIGAYGRKVGYVVLNLILKKYIPASVFPELLLESKYFLTNMDQFEYAVYKNGEILYKQGSYAFENKLSPQTLENERLYKKGIELDDFRYFGIKTSDNRILLIVSESYRVEALLANASFLLLLLVLLTAAFFIIARVLSPKIAFNLSTKIQLYLGLSFLIPMIVVSVALINTLNQSYKEEIDNNIEFKSYNISEILVDPTEAYFSNNINVDEFANEIVHAASLIQSDLNVYDADGDLIATSQPDIFRFGLLSKLLDTKAYYKIKFKREQNIISEQTIGSLSFKTSYTAIRSYQDGRLLAFLAMPYFDSRNHLHQQQVEVFNNLVVIFSFIFIISLLGGNVIISQMVKPLKQIGDKLRGTSLQETNQPISYDAQDEIGSLVKEYNAMLVKLEESKDALAAIQKESAWKEIAKQVAHEIKNPLTPMRLKIQQMMRGFEIESKQYKTCEVLIAQVDSLSSIADSFSEFAKMPAPNNEVVEIVSILNRTIDLYHGSDVKLSKEFGADQLFVYLDPKVFSRVITNILLNAIQAHKGEGARVKVVVNSNNSKITIAITDNGSGIAEEQRDKIFTPYFSTKTTGSGIGLAVAKKSIENAGGTIWFESEEGQGTTFFISLPEHQA